MDLVISNDVAEVAHISGALDAAARKCGLPDKVVMNAQVALDELISNIIKYGWPEGGRHRIDARIEITADQLQVEIVDDGLSFDPERADTRPKRAQGVRPRPGGLGLHMVKQLVDKLTYARDGDRNRTTFVVKCRPGQDGGTAVS